jgi:hypothetical protein
MLFFGDPQFEGKPGYSVFIGNHVKPGPNTEATSYVARSRYLVSGSKLFMSDNVKDGAGLEDFRVIGYPPDGIDPRVSSWPSEVPQIQGYTPMPGQNTASYVLTHAGARPADRDAVDTRIINEIQNRTGHWINSQTEVGGWPSLAVNTRTLTIPPNPHSDSDGDGYTDLEEWLHSYSAVVESTVTSPTPTPTPPPSPTPNNTGLVAHWEFDETSGITVSDSSGNGSNGTLLNGPTWTTGRIGNALSFDGVNDYVSIGNPFVLNLGTNSFTYSVWVNVTQSAGLYDMPFWKGGSNAGAAGFDMELGTGGWSAYVSDGSGTGTKGASFGLETLNQWTLLTAVVDRSNNTFKK